MDFQNPNCKRFMANAAQDQRGTFSAHIRNILGASAGGTSPEPDGDVAGGLSIFEEAVLETERDNRRAEASMAAEDMGLYEDHAEFYTHLETFDYDISEEVANNQDVPVGPHTPTDERLEMLEMDDESPPPSPTREPQPDAYEVHLDEQTPSAADVQGELQTDIQATQAPPFAEPMEEVEEEETRAQAKEERQPTASVAFWLKFVTVPLWTARSKLDGVCCVFGSSSCSSSSNWYFDLL